MAPAGHPRHGFDTPKPVAAAPLARGARLQPTGSGGFAEPLSARSTLPARSIANAAHRPRISSSRPPPATAKAAKPKSTRQEPSRAYSPEHAVALRA